MKTPTVRWILGLSVLGAFAALGIDVFLHRAPIERGAPHLSDVRTPVSPAPLTEAVREVQDRPAIRVCPRSLNLELNGSSQLVCIGAASVRDRGNLVTYDIPLEDTRGRLIIDRIGSRVSAARLELPGARRLSCDQDTCAGGIELSALEKNGERRIVLREVALLGPTVQKGLGGTRAVSVSGTVSVRERVLGEVVCDRPKLTVIESDGLVKDFCPMGGAGFEVAKDGGRKYRFDTLSGYTLTLQVARDFRLQTVELSGAGNETACKETECSGVRRLGPGHAIEDAFNFDGVLLTAVNGVVTSTLSGRLEIPSAD